MQLADDVRLEQKGHLDRNLQGFPIHQKGRGIIDVVCTGGFIGDTVKDVLVKAKCYSRSS